MFERWQSKGGTVKNGYLIAREKNEIKFQKTLFSNVDERRYSSLTAVR
jgi:hypothetical protein